MNKIEFWVGIALGFLAAGILGFITQRIRLARARMGAYRRPQTVSLPTSQTPEEVVRDSLGAGCSYVLWGLALLAFLSFLGFVLYLALTNA